jgi:sec-independent protein translocase protein TatA
MGGMSIWHWIIVGGVLLLLFGGKGKISDIMGDFAKGVKSFKKGMADDEAEQKPPVVTPVAPVVPPSVSEPRSLDHRGTTVADNETRRVG